MTFRLMRTPFPYFRFPMATPVSLHQIMLLAVSFRFVFPYARNKSLTLEFEDRQKRPRRGGLCDENLKLNFLRDRCDKYKGLYAKSYSATET